MSAQRYTFELVPGCPFCGNRFGYYSPDKEISPDEEQQVSDLYEKHLKEKHNRDQNWNKLEKTHAG